MIEYLRDEIKTELASHKCTMQEGASCLLTTNGMAAASTAIDCRLLPAAIVGAFMANKHLISIIISEKKSHAEKIASLKKSIGQVLRSISTFERYDVLSELEDTDRHFVEDC